MFRSLVCITDMTVLHLIRLLRDCNAQRHLIIFRYSYHCKEMESYLAVLQFVIQSTQQVNTLLDID
jgi:hypothetical protein